MTFEDIAKEICEMLEEKNRLYGDENLLDFGLYGVLIRMYDKLARIRVQLYAGSDKAVIEDALKDLAGYAINALRLYRTGKLTEWGRYGGEKRGA